MHDEGIDERRNRTEPGAEIGNELRDRHPRAEDERVLLPARQRADRTEHPDADARGRPDDQRDQRLRLHVADERMLHAHDQRVGPRMWREPPVDHTSEPRQVEQHVDRHDDQHDQAEQELPDRDRCALEEVDDLVRVLADVVLADIAHELVAALLHMDRPQPVVVQPDLEPVDVAVGGDLAGLSVHVRKVGIDPFRGRLRLTDEHGPERPDGGDQYNREHEVHQRDCEAAWQSDPLYQPHEWAQQERHEEGDEEEEDDVTDRPRHDPEQQQEDRQAHELDPPRDLDLRRAGRHATDRTAVVRPLRSPGWDWDWARATDGSAALDPAELWLEPPPPKQRKGGTVPRMPAPSRQAPAAARPRRRAPRRQRTVHRTRRLVVLTVVSGALLGTLFVTAFGQGATRDTSQALPGPSARLLPAGPPTPLTVALHNGLRIQLPVTQSRVTAIGYHSGDDGELTLTPLGHQ